MHVRLPPILPLQVVPEYSDTYASTFVIRYLCQITTYSLGLATFTYSNLSNKRAGWNKHAGSKFCPILGNFDSLNSCRVG